MKILIHMCCAHCYAKFLTGLQQEEDKPAQAAGLWFNPNIHPLIEYRRRLKAVRMLAERHQWQVHILDEYGLKSFCRQIHPNYDMPERCRTCYQIRLEEAAGFAAANGYDTLATTLCTSRHQDHNLIRDAGQQAAANAGIGFWYRDLRESEPDPKLLQGLYKQQYCGCVFSEEDRYRNTTLHCYEKAGRNEQPG